MLQIACHPGGRHYLAAGARGSAWSWGCGRRGQLGLGADGRQARDRPARIPGLRGRRITCVACGPSSSAALSVRGVLYLWGEGGWGTQLLTPVTIQLPLGEKVVHMALGELCYLLTYLRCQ